MAAAGHAISSAHRSHCGPKRTEESGANVNPNNDDLVPQRNTLENRSSSSSADEVRHRQRPQRNRVPPPPTAISLRVARSLGSTQAMCSPTTLLLDGISSGSPIKSVKCSSPVSTEESSVEHLAPSTAQSCSQFSHHRHLSVGKDPPFGRQSLPWNLSSATDLSSTIDLKSGTHPSIMTHIAEDSPDQEMLSPTFVSQNTRNHGIRCDEPEDDDESLPATPLSGNSSVLEAQETPMTSPSGSPAKQRPLLWYYPFLAQGTAQIDGLDELSDETGGDLSSHESYQTSRTHLTEDNDDECTPTVAASFAKDATAFPFPKNSSFSSSTQCLGRHPSMLLRQCESKATARQKRLFSGGTRIPDRFIPSRAATPTKQAFLLPRVRPGQPLIVAKMPDFDPFGPIPSRSLRMAEQYATIRSPPQLPRIVGCATQAEGSSPLRSVSTGSVWTVGGTVVTEGIASVANGRGGRVTSGTNAPHFSADFLSKKTPSEDEVLHSKRLAVAMDIDQSARMLAQSSLSSPEPSSGHGASLKSGSRVWRDGIWQNDGIGTPTKSTNNKVKSVPVIPFRVLDAPALRDDYYCSLLSYSFTLQCLAMGLGPHVYLWSEKRERTDIPDSLTAAAGSAHITSVSFSSSDGGSAILALGRADGRITLWSPFDRDPRFDSDQPSPVSCLSFRPGTVMRCSLRDSNAKVPTEELLVGDELGFVYYYSIEWPNLSQRDLFDWHGSMTLLARINCHSQQVCGLAWSSDGQYFATGGNDNQLFLFESKNMVQTASSRRTSANAAVRVRASSSNSSNGTVTGQGPVVAITPGSQRQVFDLNAAVKAIAFAPWQPTLLAAGGGSNDRCIHFFHTLSASTLATIDCHAQVTSLVWSEKRKEIAGTFGFAQPEHPYRVAVFAWPSCDLIVKIPWWGEERALFAVAYPRGPTTGIRRSDSRTTRRADAEGRPWYGRRTREEGCLVVATSDASIKFHEIWAEKAGGGGKVAGSGVFGGSQILEEQHGGDIERWGTVIR